MQTLKSIGISFLVAVLVVLGASYLAPTKLGAAGSDFYNLIQFFSGLRTASVLYTPTIVVLPASATTTTILASQICNGDIFEWYPVSNNSTATIDTTANLQNNCLSANGNNVKVNIWDLSPTSTFNVSLAANETLFHASGSATTTITSSTPAEYMFYMSAISTTSTVSSTVAAFQSAKLTP